MKPARSLFSLLLSGALAAQGPVPTPGQPVLAIDMQPFEINFLVEQHAEPFLGVVILSLSTDLVHYYTLLPPLLADYVVVGIGVSAPGGVFRASVPEPLFPAGIFIQAQGVTYFEGTFQATDVGSFVLDETFPKK